MKHASENFFGSFSFESEPAPMFTSKTSRPANSASATLWEENERALAARQAAAEADLQARVAADGADARRSYRAQAIRDVVAVATGAGVWLAVGMMAAHWLF